MSSPGEETCPTCHAAIAPGSTFCTRCGSALQVREIVADLGAGQQWGKAASRRGAGRGRASTTASGRTGAGVPAPALSFDAPAGVQVLDPQDGPITAATYGAALGPAFDGVWPAGTGRRLGAFALDTVVVLAVAGAVWWFTRSALVAALVVAELAAGLVVWEARSGRTIGNALLGLRTARDDVPFAPGLWRAAGRAALLAAAHVTGLGQWVLVASSGFDPQRRQAWHDKLAGTVVVDVRRLRQEEVPEAFVPPVVTGPALPVPEQWPGQEGVPAPGTAAQPVPSSPVDQYRVPAPPAPVPPTPAPPTAALPTPAPPTAAPVQPEPVQPEVVQPVAATSYVVTLDDGRAMTVSGPGYIGRRPQAQAGERCDHVIEIEDPGRSLSRTHARFGIDADGFWVEDNGSANGTAVIASDGSAVQGAPGERLVVPPGATVRLGDRTVTVHPLP